MIEPSWTIIVSFVLEYKKSSIFKFTFITHVVTFLVCVITMKDKMHVPPLKIMNCYLGYLKVFIY